MIKYTKLKILSLIVFTFLSCNKKSEIKDLKYQFIGGDNTLKLSWEFIPDENFKKIEVSYYLKDDASSRKYITEKIVDNTAYIKKLDIDNDYIITIKAFNNKLKITDSNEIEIRVPKDNKAPNEVTNVKHYYNKIGRKWLLEWENPTDLDYFSTIILLDNNEINKTSNNYLEIFDLDFNRNYQIIIKNLDINGNISSGYSYTLNTSKIFYNDEELENVKGLVYDNVIKITWLKPSIKITELELLSENDSSFSKVIYLPNLYNMFEFDKKTIDINNTYKIITKNKYGSTSKGVYVNFISDFLDEHIEYYEWGSIFARAIIKRDIAEVNSIITNKDYDNNNLKLNPLYYYIEKRDWENIRFLLSTNLNQFYVDPSDQFIDRTFINDVIKKNDIEMVEFLLKNKANTDLITLHNVQTSEMLNVILDNNFNINSPKIFTREKGLYYTWESIIKRENIDLLEILINAGVNINSIFSYDYDSLEITSNTILENRFISDDFKEILKQYGAKKISDFNQNDIENIKYGYKSVVNKPSKIYKSNLAVESTIELSEGEEVFILYGSKKMYFILYNQSYGWIYKSQVNTNEYGRTFIKL